MRLPWIPPTGHKSTSVHTFGNNRQSLWREKAFAPWLADAKQIFAAGRECDMHRAAAPASNVFLDLGNLIVCGAGVAQQLDQRGLFSDPDPWADGRAGIFEAAMQTPFVTGLEIDNDAHRTSLAEDLEPAPPKDGSPFVQSHLMYCSMETHFYYVVTCKSSTCGNSSAVKYLGFRTKKLEANIEPSTFSHECPRCHKNYHYDVSEARVQSFGISPPPDWADEF